MGQIKWSVDDLYFNRMGSVKLTQENAANGIRASSCEVTLNPGPLGELPCWYGIDNGTTQHYPLGGDGSDASPWEPVKSFSFDFSFDYEDYLYGSSITRAATIDTSVKLGTIALRRASIDCAWKGSGEGDFNFFDRTEGFEQIYVTENAKWSASMVVANSGSNTSGSQPEFEMHISFQSTVSNKTDDVTYGMPELDINWPDVTTRNANAFTLSGASSAPTIAQGGVAIATPYKQTWSPDEFMLVQNYVNQFSQGGPALEPINNAPHTISFLGYT